MPNLNLSARKDLEPYKTNHAIQKVYVQFKMRYKS